MERVPEVVPLRAGAAGGETVSGPTVDEKIEAVQRYIRMLKDDQKRLSKKIVQNRQDQASARNMLKKLQEEKEAGK